MTQATLFGPAPVRPAESPRDRGHRLAKACQKAAEIRSDFDSEGASKFILGWLRAYGPTSGEDLTDAAQAHGYRPHDGRSFGGVFLRLINAKEVEILREDLPRRRGHGTSGGRLYGAKA